MTLPAWLRRLFTRRNLQRAIEAVEVTEELLAVISKATPLV